MTLVVTPVLSITDQVGLVDLAPLAGSVAPLGLLLKDRAWVLRRIDAPGGATMVEGSVHRPGSP